MAEAKKKTVRIHLFKDNGRYKDDVFVGVNGVNYMIQRGVDVEVPPEVAEVLEHSQMQDMAAAQKVAQLEADQIPPARRRYAVPGVFSYIPSHRNGPDSTAEHWPGRTSQALTRQLSLKGEPKHFKEENKI